MTQRESIFFIMLSVLHGASQDRPERDPQLSTMAHDPSARTVEPLPGTRGTWELAATR
jgi:hypothetical protein